MNAELEGNLKRLGARSKTLSVRFFESLLNGVCGVRVCTNLLHNWGSCVTGWVSHVELATRVVKQVILMRHSLLFPSGFRGFCVVSADQDSPAKYHNVAVTTVHVCMQRSLTLAHQSCPHSCRPLEYVKCEPTCSAVSPSRPHLDCWLKMSTSECPLLPDQLKTL